MRRKGSALDQPSSPARGTEARTGVLELPSDDRVPLVQLEGQISVRTNPLGVVGVHHRLGRGTNRDRLLEVRLTSAGDPRDLGRETLDVVLLPLEHLGRHKHGEVGVLHAELLAGGASRQILRHAPDRRGKRGHVHSRVEPVLDLLPDAVTRRLEDVAPRDIVVVEHLTLDQHLGVPFSKVGLTLFDRNSELDPRLALELATCGRVLLDGRSGLGLLLDDGGLGGRSAIVSDGDGEGEHTYAVRSLIPNSSSTTAAPSALSPSMTVDHCDGESCIVAAGSVGEGTRSVCSASVEDVRIKVVAASVGGSDKGDAAPVSPRVTSREETWTDPPPACVRSSPQPCRRQSRACP